MANDELRALLADALCPHLNLSHGETRDMARKLREHARTLEREAADLREKLDFEFHSLAGSHSLLKTAWKQRDDLRELLRIEFLRHDRIEAPWHCVEGDCPYLGKPVPKGLCKCYDDFQRTHVDAVRKEIGL